MSVKWIHEFLEYFEYRINVSLGEQWTVVAHGTTYRLESFHLILFYRWIKYEVRRDIIPLFFDQLWTRVFFHINQNKIMIRIYVENISCLVFISRTINWATFSCSTVSWDFGKLDFRCEITHFIDWCSYNGKFLICVILNMVNFFTFDETWQPQYNVNRLGFSTIFKRKFQSQKFDLKWK